MEDDPGGNHGGVGPVTKVDIGVESVTGPRLEAAEWSGGWSRGWSYRTFWRMALGTSRVSSFTRTMS